MDVAQGKCVVRAGFLEFRLEVGLDWMGEVLEVASSAVGGEALGDVGGGHFGLFVGACLLVVDEIADCVC